MTVVFLKIVFEFYDTNGANFENNIFFMFLVYLHFEFEILKFKIVFKVIKL